MSDTSMDLRGKHASCRVHTQHVESSAMQQIYEFLNSPAFDGCEIRIMPDVHAGSGAVIGFTSKIGPGVVPNVVGVDIGCGVAAVNIGHVPVFDFEDFDEMLRANVPSGFMSRATPYPRDKVKALYRKYLSPTNVMGDPLAPFEKEVEALAGKLDQEPGKVWRSLGTLGGGNHFIEIDVDEDRNKWLTVHSGSRNFGLKVCLYHQEKAVKAVGKKGGLEWLEGDAAQEYLRDMRTAQKFATLNRMVMLDALTSELDYDLRDLEMVESVHNFIGDDDIIRKGAISAQAGERVIIPWNMRDGLVIGVGKGNPDWNNSAPHGSGRKMARGVAKRSLSMDDFRHEMDGIWSSCVCRDTLDESPMAYKPTDDVRAIIGDTVEIENNMLPVYNFKATGE